MPLKTASLVSQRSNDDFGESFISRKKAHSFFLRLSNSESLKSDVLKCHLWLGLWEVLLFLVNVAGAWSLMIISWIFDSEIWGIIELLERKKLIREDDWWAGEKKEYCFVDGCCWCQISLRLKSFMNCLVMSVDCKSACYRCGSASFFFWVCDCIEITSYYDNYHSLWSTKKSTSSMTSDQQKVRHFEFCQYFKQFAELLFDQNPPLRDFPQWTSNLGRLVIRGWR